MTADLDTVLDRPLPGGREAEQAAERAVLGSIILNAGALHRVSPPLIPSDFYREAHRAIFSALLTLDADGTVIDFLSVREELTRRGKLELLALDWLQDVQGIRRCLDIAKQARGCP